jgi:tetratricopeptide (TPR) repeat protein
MLRRGQALEAAEADLAAGRTTPASFRTLAEQRRAEDAMRLLPSQLDGPADAVIPMIQAVGSALSDLQRAGDRYVDRLRGALAPVRRRLATMPREQAAALARALVSIDNQLERGGSAGYARRIAAFVQEWAGTEAARLAEVDAIDAAPLRIPERVARLEQFWRDHPGTAAGASALYRAGSHLAHNAYNGLEPRGGDPTNRLLRLIEIVRELESGRYPPGEWTTNASSLVSGMFYSSQPPVVIPPENVARMLDAWYDFVRTRFDGRREDAFDSGVGYIVTSRMSDLFARQGSAVAGVERTLDRLEKDVADSGEVRWFRAMYYVRQWMSGPEAERVAMGARARAALRGVASDESGYRARKALATLAAMAYADSDFAGAVPLFREYLASYPRTPWSWIAALRLGLAHEAQGDWTGAAAAFDDASRRFGATEPVALVLSAAFAARAYEALGQHDRALAAYRRAVDGWDEDYGVDYVLNGPRPNPPAIPSRPDERHRVRRDDLVERTATLARMLQAPGGALLARGRWQLSVRRFDDARATLQEYLRSHSSSALAGDAHALLHRALVERALELAAVDAPRRDDDAAARLLDEAAAATPYTAWSAFAGMTRSAMAVRAGDAASARASARQALSRLVDAQKPLLARPSADAVDRDVASIRALVFRPTGDLPLIANQQWSVHTFPAALPEFVVVSADIPVSVPGSQPAARRGYQPLPGIERVVFLTRDELAALERIIPTIGGTAVRGRRGVMDTFNQPAGGAREIVKVWGEVFPTQPGHWGGTVLQTYPMITRIDFLDTARTRANVAITVGYSGATVVVEKVEGVWRAVRVTNWWIT